MKHRQINGFTLLELLAVVAILGVLFAVGIPAVTSLMKSTALSSASRQVYNNMSLARQYAISQRTKTRVLFPYRVANGTVTSMWWNTYAIVLLTNSAADASPGSWKYLSDWEYLPEGTVFKIVGIGLLNTDHFPHPTNSIVSNRVYYIEFGPNGVARGSVNQRKIQILEGYLDATPGAGTQIFTYARGGTTNNYVDISADNFTGRIKVSRP